MALLIVKVADPCGRGINRECPRWVLSVMMDLAVLCRWSTYTESRSGSAVPTILCAVLTTWDRSLLFSTVQPAYHTVPDWQRMLSIILL